MSTLEGTYMATRVNKSDKGTAMQLKERAFSCMASLPSCCCCCVFFSNRRRKSEVSKNKMPPLNHLPTSCVRGVIGNTLIFAKVTVFHNLLVAFPPPLTLFIPLLLLFQGLVRLAGTCWCWDTWRSAIASAMCSSKILRARGWGTGAA